MTQYGFFFDQSRCIGCNACVVACKQWHNIPVGPVKWMRVYQWEKGLFPSTRMNMLAIPCYHCEDPKCVKACRSGALYKEEKYGAVLVDSGKCQGSRRCWKACPYGTPQYEGDGPGLTMSKCDMCFDRLEQGLTPICVLSCSMRALEFGRLEDLRTKYGRLRRLEDLPRDSIAKPSVVMKAAVPPKQIIPWDYSRALELWQKRQPRGNETLPEVFLSVAGVLAAPQDIVGRHELVLKAKTVAEQMYYTTDDE